MAIVPMQKVAVLSERTLREEVLDALQKQGMLEIMEVPTTEVMDHTEVNFRTAELKAAVDTLKDFATKQTEQAMQKIPSPEQVIAAAQGTDVRGIVDRLSALEEEDTNVRRILDELRVRKSVLQPWVKLGDRLDAALKTSHAVRLYGMVPSSRIEECKMLARDASAPVELEIFDEASGSFSVAATVLASARETFEERATALGWTEVQLPKLSGTPKEIVYEDSRQQQRLEALLEQNRKARVALSAELPSLLSVQLFLGWLKDKQAVRESLIERFATTTLFGWVPKARVNELEKALSKVSPAVAVIRVKPDAGEEPPVYLTNNKFITPFESVTTLYGLPLPTEMDPTFPLAPFFALYFALCLTDGGYGLALTLIFGMFLLIKRPTVKEATLPWLLFISGIASVLVGIPFGGWFGLTPEQAPSFLTMTDANGVLWFRGQLWNLSTQTGINFLQYLSLVLGITHIFFGVFLAGWFKWIHGEKAEAFWQYFTLHILLGSAIFVGFAPPELHQIALYTLYAALALTIWGKGHGSGLIARPIMGLLGLINFAIGLLSNGLSYLRILALGLVTGAIALAVNQVALQIGNLFPPVVGIPVMILIALGGHLVSIALNTLGAFIHSGRLQFIEFFGQFFEGGGRPYSPFRRSTH